MKGRDSKLRDSSFSLPTSSFVSWRRGWDSNPRWALTHSGFRDRCTNPLCDLSPGERMKGPGGHGDAETGRHGDKTN